HRESLAALILRYIDPPDDLVAGLVADGDLQIPAESRGLQTIVLSGLSGSEPRNAGQSLSLSDLMGSSALVFQIFIDLSAANEACGVQSSLPVIEHARGTVKIKVNGGLFAPAIRLLVACSAGLAGAPFVQSAEMESLTS